MKKRGTVSVLMLTAILFLAGVRTGEGSKITRGPDPGFVSEVTYSGTPEQGAILEVTCRFSIPTDAIGAVYLDSLKQASLVHPADTYLRRDIGRPDSVHIRTVGGIDIVSAASWGGSIDPGQEYIFTVTIQLNSPLESQVYFVTSSRYGIQVLGTLVFFPGKRSIPLGYITEVTVDSTGNYWHRHKTVMDSTLAGFVPFDSTGTKPLDTLYDRSGKVLSVQQVTVKVIRVGDEEIRKLMKPLKIGPGLRHIQQKPTHKKP